LTARRSGAAARLQTITEKQHHRRGTFRQHFRPRWGQRASSRTGVEDRSSRKVFLATSWCWLEYCRRQHIADAR
jgi:hypothetical protein